MSWVTIAWSISSAICLTLGIIYLLIWWKRRDRWAYLLFASSAVAAAVIGALELQMLYAESAEYYGRLAKAMHLPVWALVVSLVWFIRVSLRAGRLWLAWIICSLRTVALGLNFLVSPNLNYRQLARLDHIEWWGGQTVAVPVGVYNPWALIGQISVALLIVFLVDAAVAVWRRGEHQRAIVMGGSTVFLVATSLTESALVITGVLHWPIIISLPYLALVVVMAGELCSNFAQSMQLAGELQTRRAEWHEGKQRLDLAVDGGRIGLWTWNVSGDQVWINERGRALFGFSATEKLDLKRFRSRVHPEDREKVHGAATRALTPDSEYEIEYRIVLPNGQIRWLHGRGRAEFDARGKPWQIHGVSFDITDRKQAEQEVQRHRDEVTHLTRVSLMGEISASLAHELNQPLAAIVSNAAAGRRFIDQGNVDLEELSEILADISADGRRASEVVGSIRGMVRKGESVRQRINLNEVVNHVVRLSHPDALLRSCEVKTSLQPELPAVDGDPIQFRQVLLNLVINAFDAMRDTPLSQRTVEITTAANPDGKVRTSVRDHGVGLSQIVRDRLFDPFFTTKNEGMGMGLAIVRSIVESHGGQIGAENLDDGGALFSFTLAANAAPSL